MVQHEEKYQEDLLSLCYATSNMSDFSHLEKWEDFKTKIENAKRTVKALREQTKGYFDIIKEKEEKQQHKENYKLHLSQTEDYKMKLNDFKERFIQLASESNAQKRGYEFEKFLNELFTFFDLYPKALFKISGEQIDGVFTFKNTDYLFRSKMAKGFNRSKYFI